MNFKYVLISLIVVFFHQYAFTQESISSDITNEYTILDPDFDDGNCYAKCILSNQYKTYLDQYAVYTGNTKLEDVETETITIELQPTGTQWVKKKADRNCIARDPNDCLVWCLIETKAITKTITILLDTTQSKNYEIIDISKNELIRKSGFTEWRQVLCPDDVQPQLISQLQNILSQDGYYYKPNTSKFDRDTKDALTHFQMNNNLPIGKLDFETLHFLGFEIGL